MLQFAYMTFAIRDAAKRRPEILNGEGSAPQLIAAAAEGDALRARRIFEGVLDEFADGSWRGVWTAQAVAGLSPRPVEPLPVEDLASVRFLRRGRDPSRGLDCWGLMLCLFPSLPRMFIRTSSRAVDAEIWAALTAPDRQFMGLANSLSVFGQDRRWEILDAPEPGCLVHFLDFQGAGEDHTGACFADANGGATQFVNMVAPSGFARMNIPRVNRTYFLRWLSN